MPAGRAASDVSASLEFRLLGPLEVRCDGRTVDLGAYRQRSLLAVLLLCANEVVSRDRLIGEVWGEEAPVSARNMVQVYVSRLRKALGRGLLLTQPPGYVLRVGEAQLDSIRFSALVTRAHGAMADGEPGAARDLLVEAIALWRGPPLADFTYESFAQREVGRLEELRLEAIELRIDADLAVGRHARLVGELEHLITLHPFRERLRGQLMLALYQSGRQAEALEAYRAARSTLVEELGIEPSVALQRLEQAILAQDRELQAAAATPAARRPVADGAFVGNLAPELTSLLGRESDLDRVAGLVSEYRMVTVVGPGGVGKTRVAQRVASTIAHGFQQGAWFVDLAAIDPADHVADAVCSAVGISDRPGSAALDTVLDELRERRLLLVLDNCEHVLRSGAEVATRLVSECRGVRILATSREPLAIAGERVTRLEPLATTANGSGPPAAVALFLDRAASHGAYWEQPEKVLDAIRELCAKLDGMPLAIELAAARTRAISPAELLAHLDDRLRLLARPAHSSAHARQQTLEATIAWSYELLSGEDQATLRRLSVFHGGFSLAAAAAVCADVGAKLETLERVTALVDRSVVSIQRRDDSDRYRLLDSISLFAKQRLRNLGEQAGALDRHARFFLRFARDTSDQEGGTEQVVEAARIDASPARLDAEQDNLTAALGWCMDEGGDPTVGAELAADLGFHWTCRGRSNAAEHWLSRSLERGEDIAPATLVTVHLAYAVLAYSTGEIDTVTAHATEAARISRLINDNELLAEALAHVALAHQASGGRGDGSTVVAELRSLQPRLSSPRGRVMALLGTAQVALASGHPDRATVDTSRAREIAGQAGDHVRAALSGFWLAYALALDSKLPSARAVIAEAKQDAVRSGYQLLVVDNLVAESSLALADDDLETVRRVLPLAVEMLREQQRWDDVGRRLYVAAAVELKDGFPERSAVLLGAALRWTDHLDYQDEMLLPELADLGDRLSASLGVQTFARASERGAEMALDSVARLLEATKHAS